MDKLEALRLIEKEVEKFKAKSYLELTKIIHFFESKEQETENGNTIKPKFRCFGMIQNIETMLESDAPLMMVAGGHLFR